MSIDETSSRELIWITGASSGIGRELALRYVERGSKVIVTARSKESLEELAAHSTGHRIVPMPGDVTDAKRMAEIVELVEAEHGPIDMAILNAGIYLPVDALSLEHEQIDKTFAVNVTGTVNCLLPVLGAMKTRRRGTIAFVSSVAGYGGLPTSAAYGASKAALINLAESLKLELHRSGIDIRLINPGFVDTPATKKNSFTMPAIISAPDASRRIVDGLAGRAFEITFPRRFTWVLKLLNLLPYRLYFPIVRRFTGK